MSDVERRFGKLSLHKLLEPQALQEIFGGATSAMARGQFHKSRNGGFYPANEDEHT